MITSKKTIRDRFFILVMPALIIYGIFLIYPMISSFYYSMTDWNGLSKEIHFTGIRNFVEMLRDDRLHNAVLNTIKIVAMTLCIEIPMALFFSLILDSNIRTKNILRTLIFLPIVLSPMVISYIWGYMYSYDMGLINKVLDAIGLGMLKVDWLGVKSMALFAVTWTSIWQWFGFPMVIFLAGLQNIPQDVIEAAKIDGVRRFSMIKNITIPLLAPAFTVNIIIVTIGALKTFDTVFIMTRGGPGMATETITTTIYSNAFLSNNLGYGTAIGLVLFALIAVVTIFQVKFLRSKEVDI